MSNNKTSSAVRLFGDLKVRPKLMVLHNLFFLVLTCAVYFSIIPLFEKQVADAQARELTILHQTQAPGQDLNAPNKLYAEAAARAKLTLFSFWEPFTYSQCSFWNRPSCLFTYTGLCRGCSMRMLRLKGRQGSRNDPTRGNPWR